MTVPTARDALYYLDTIVFLVEDTLFKVPQYHFENSSKGFQALPKGDDVEGSSDKNPLRLEGISKLEFQRFIRVLYPLDIPQILAMPQDDWISVLKLSHTWKFWDVRKLAIQQLSSPIPFMNTIDKIILAKEYAIPNWLVEGYSLLARRKETISMEEAIRLGFDTTVGVFHVREVVRADISYIRGTTLGRGNGLGPDYASIVEKEFCSELKDIRAAYAAYEAACVECKPPQDRGFSG